MAFASRNGQPIELGQHYLVQRLQRCDKLSLRLNHRNSLDVKVNLRYVKSRYPADCRFDERLIQTPARPRPKTTQAHNQRLRAF